MKSNGDIIYYDTLGDNGKVISVTGKENHGYLWSSPIYVWI